MKQQIIALLAEGKTTAQIADAVDTSRNYVRRVRAQHEAVEAVKTVMQMFLREAPNLTKFTAEEQEAVNALEKWLRRRGEAVE